ncbi:MAG: EthD family reductase [Actinomycetes bacterium]
MTFKAIILLRRRDDMTHEEFATWWLDKHAPLAATLPGVRRLCFNLADDGAAFDGVSELWFDTREDFDAAYATEIGKAVAADSMAHLSARERLFAAENFIVN